jgi:hypothetical protein
MTKTTFCNTYVNNHTWETGFANAFGYILASPESIGAARRIVLEKGTEVTRNPQDKGLKSIYDYLFQRNLVKINFFRTRKLVPLCGPDIEIHSETVEGLEKLAKELGLLK